MKTWMKCFIVGLILIVVSICGYLYYNAFTIVWSVPDDQEMDIAYGETYTDDVTAEARRIGSKKGLQLAVEREGEVDCGKIGTYVLKYKTSFRNKTETITRTVNVIDSVPPVITLAGDAEISIEAGSEYQEPGYAAVDLCDGDVSSNMVVEGLPDSMEPGDYTLKYCVKDNSGNEAEAQRILHVVDTTPPTIELQGNTTVVVAVGDTYTEPGYTANDTVDGDCTGSVEVSGEVDSGKAGTYTLTYSVADQSGNSSTCTRTIYVNQAGNTTSDGNGKVIYLTFDDGPGPYTEKLLDVLDKYGVKATFFVTNAQPKYRSMIAEEASRGHTVAIHSATHEYSQIYQSVDAYFADLQTMSDIITEQTGKTPWLLRFPGGSSNTVSRKYCSGIMSTLTKEVESRGYQYCDWNVSSGDAGETTSTATVVENVISGVKTKNSSVVLQHDIKEFSVNAVEEIIQWGLSNGYTFLPLSEDSPMAHHNVQN